MFLRSRVLLLIPHLGGGGAERVMAHLARSLPKDRFDVHLGLVTGEQWPGEDLPRCVPVHMIGARRVLFGAFGLVRMVRRLRPDVILSGMYHLNLLVLMLRPLFPRETRILVRQNGLLPLGSDEPDSRLTIRLLRATYPRADGIICQTQKMADDMMCLVGSRSKVFTLRNPVDGERIRRTAADSRSSWNGNGPHILAVGRLSPEKGFDLLIEAFSAVHSRYPEADLTILGQGACEIELRAKCRTMGLDDYVTFAGYVADPAAWLAGASLLASPSREDAFPNVLLEAAAAGLPIVATPCSAGVSELLHCKAGVWLTQNASSDALAKSLLVALASLGPGERFCHAWLDPFELKESITAYETLILETLMGNGRHISATPESARIRPCSASDGHVTPPSTVQVARAGAPPPQVV